MASTTTALLNSRFGGIRRKDSDFSQDKITCSDCQNAELFFTELNSGIGVRSAKGNVAISKHSVDLNFKVFTISNEVATQVATDGEFTTEGEEITFTVSSVEIECERSDEDDVILSGVPYYAFADENENLYYTLTLTTPTEIQSLIPANENIVGMFESILDNQTYFFIYTENTTAGKLYYFNAISHTLTQVTTNTALSVTGTACATDFQQGWLDMFIFSNGKEVVYLYINTETHGVLTVESAANIHLKDDLDPSIARDVYGLGIKIFDKRLWIFNDRVLWYSSQTDCRDFRPSGDDLITDAGNIEMVKSLTAIYPYLGSLAVFHKDSSSLVKLNTDTRFLVEDESPGGCAGYDSLVFHGVDLYFYDDTKKGVFSFQQVINGDKTLGENIALDIQDELMDIKKSDVSKIRTLSVVTSDRNEVWFLVPISKEANKSIVLIFDYIRGEWVKRKCQKINCMQIINSTLYSGGKDVYEEYTTDTFDGTFIESFYKCTILNMGADNTLKITKFPPRITIDGNSKCHFWVQYLKNYDQYKSPKNKEITAKTFKGIIKYDAGYHYDSGYIYVPKKTNLIVKLPSSTFKALEIKFLTKSSDQEFSIKAIEFSKIKVKQV